MTDHIELYIDPNRDGNNYFHLLTDPAGTIEDVRVTASGRAAWKGDYDVKTSLNWKVGWTAEFKIPFKSLEKKPKPGEVWGINFARKDLAGTWSNWATAGEWLDPAGFGEIEFALGTEAAKPQARNPQDDPSVLFHASLSGTATPDVHKGSAAFQAAKELTYTDAPGGKALVVGHTKNVVYSAAGNLDVRAGTIKFWLRPVNWNRNQRNSTHFLSISAAADKLPQDARPFSLLLYRHWEWDQILAYGMHQYLRLPDGNPIFSVEMDDTWVAGKWHQIIFTWDKKGEKLFVDGKGASGNYEGKPPDALGAGHIQLGGPYFAKNDSLTAISDFTIYNRSFSIAEIQAAFRLGPSQSPATKEGDQSN